MGSHAVIIGGVRHGLSGGSHLRGGDDDEEPDGGRGRAMLGAGAFELSAAAVVSHAGRRSRADDADVREKARRTEVGLRTGPRTLPRSTVGSVLTLICFSFWTVAVGSYFEAFPA